MDVEDDRFSFSYNDENTYDEILVYQTSNSYRPRDTGETDGESDSDSDTDVDDHESDCKTEAYYRLVGRFKREVKDNLKEARDNFKEVKDNIKGHLGLRTADGSDDDDDYIEEEGDEDDDADEGYPGCIVTYSIDQGREHSEEYIVELQEELKMAVQKLEQVKEEMRFWQSLHQTALEDYIFQPGLLPPPPCNPVRPSCLNDGGSRQNLVDPPNTKLSKKRRIIADRRAWELIHGAEMKLVELEQGRLDDGEENAGGCICDNNDGFCECGEDIAGLNDWENDVLMYRAELLLCEVTLYPQPPGGWAYNIEPRYRVWDPTKDRNNAVVRADNWGSVPQYQRPLWYKGIRYN